MLDQTTTGELLGATGEVLPDETEPASPKHSLPDATNQDSLPINESNNTDVNVSPSDMTVQEPVSEPPQLLLDPVETTATTNDIKNESESNLSESKGTKEKIVGEITFTDLENTNSDSKGNLTLDDMPLGVSGMHPLETSSVISDPMDRPVLESTTTTSTTSNNLPDQNTEETKHIGKKARLKSCIIRLTELSNSECEKWLTSESSSSQINKTTESIESSSSSGSQYNMRSRPFSTSA